jgi:hypothetical protein
MMLFLEILTTSQSNFYGTIISFQVELKMPGYIHHLQMCVSDLGRLQQIFSFIEY